MRIDLQVHSTYSDGYLTPSELVKFLAAQGVRVASLTDHNTVSGLGEFRKAASRAGIKTINGLELYVTLNARRFNILWYNFDATRPELHDQLRESQVRRRRRLRRVLENLTARGFKLKIDKILDKYNHYVPINRIVDELVSSEENMRRVKKDLKISHPREEDIIRYYFYNPKFEILRDSYINIDRVLRLRKKIGGQLVLCHPGKNRTVKKVFWQEMKRKGIDGVEILSPHHPYGGIMYMQSLARELNFIETGGSDFHRFEGGGFPLQSAGQYFSVDSKLLKGVSKIIV